MSKKVLVVITIVALILILSLTACSNASPSTTVAPNTSTAPQTQTTKVPVSDGKVYKLQYGVISDETPGHIDYNPITNRFKDLVYEKSGGRLVIESKIDLVPDTEVAAAVIDGRLDMGNFMANWSSGTFPTWDFSLPFLFSDTSQFEKLTQDPEFLSLMRKSYAAKGLYYIGECNVGGNDTIWSNKPIKTLADLKNLKIRSGGLMPTVALKELGAAPVTMTFSEIAEAMNRGTIDAVISDILWAPQVGFLDVAKYVNYWNVNVPGGGIQVINLDKWNSLPPDLQQVLNDAVWEMIRADNWAVYNGHLQMEKVLAVVKDVVAPDKAELDKAAQIASPKVKEEWLKTSEPIASDLLKLIEKYNK